MGGGGSIGNGWNHFNIISNLKPDLRPVNIQTLPTHFFFYLIMFYCRVADVDESPSID